MAPKDNNEIEKTPKAATETFKAAGCFQLQRFVCVAFSGQE
jgi:hypothetical protein